MPEFNGRKNPHGITVTPEQGRHAMPRACGPEGRSDVAGSQASRSRFSFAFRARPISYGSEDVSGGP